MQVSLNTLNTLPAEMLFKIFSQCSRAEAAILRQVDQRLNEVATACLIRDGNREKIQLLQESFSVENGQSQQTIEKMEKLMRTVKMLGTLDSTSLTLDDMFKLQIKTNNLSNQINKENVSSLEQILILKRINFF